MKGFCGAVLVIMLSVLAMPVYSEEKRALVIGNGNYQHIGTLKNPVNDARTVAQTLRLRQLGFQVTELHNRNRKQMARAITQFGNSIKPDSTVLVYFAGHGAQYQGVNYLFPVDFETQDEKELPIEAVSTSFIMDHLKRNTNGLNILVLDACRNNPLSASGRSGTRGLTRIDDAPPNTYSIYATSPGKVASDNSNEANGLFTKHLVKYMKQPGLDLGNMVLETRKDVMKASGNKQIPYDYGTLTERFCLAGCEVAGSTVVAAPASQPAVAPKPQPKPAPQTQSKPQAVASNEHRHGNRSHAHPLPATGVNHQHGAPAQPVQTVTQTPVTPASSKRFTVNGDGTVSDRQTGLMWKQCSEGLLGASCQDGFVKGLTWQQAMDLKGSQFAGYNDWRLPTRDELQSLVYCSNGTPSTEALESSCSGKNNRNGTHYQSPTISSIDFPNTESGFYWSSSALADHSSLARGVAFYEGNFGVYFKTGARNVRLVRGGQ